MSGGRGGGVADSSDPPLLQAGAVGGYEDIPAVVDRLRSLKAQMDGAVHELRGWWHVRSRDERLPEPDSPPAAVRGLGDTVGGLAHNFNNSLAVIVSYTDLLLKNAADDTTARRLAVVRQVAREAAGTVRLLQEFLARRPDATSGPVALQAVVDDALALTEPRWRAAADRRGVRIGVTRELDGAPPVHGNYLDLREAFTLLIASALDALPGGGDLVVRAWSDPSGWVVAQVRDTGSGIRELGRASAIAERHGGTLRTLTDMGQGTTVELRLLASSCQIIGAGDDSHPPLIAESRRILLVDDDPRLLRALTDLLQDYGHVVVSAGSGAEALDFLRGDSIDLIVTDLGMPGMTGWELAAEVKRLSPEIPVYLMTGWGEEVATDERSRLVDRILAKPVSAEALLSPLAALSRSPGRAAQ